MTKLLLLENNSMKVQGRTLLFVRELQYISFCLAFRSALMHGSCDLRDCIE